MSFKNIQIGLWIKSIVEEKKIKISEISEYFNIPEIDIIKMYDADDIDTDILLKWSVLLHYDFFRLYSQHLILYAPTNLNYTHKAEKSKPVIYGSAKNIYTKEIIDFILELIETNEKTTSQVMTEYKIPKTTLYKWIKKYRK
ncbi:transposase [Chryseobacterium defluvii]|uniref:Uncharacterized protein n=1 Tax=Chryseobacterium defluvii TaxID=160396 RepID=A0A495SCG8_9FLAO|nr:transposase [Chryseobacterium defluvii]RKS97932.1 hypothetical protein BCF58_2066 [Chryseobacterium defluvii]